MIDQNDEDQVLNQESNWLDQQKSSLVPFVVVPPADLFLLHV